MSKIQDMKKKRKLSSILRGKKFFINIRNHSVQLKYETKLKSLGAVISPFLDKEVNFVLTDIQGCNGKVSVATETSILSPPCYSVSPATSVSGDDYCATKKTRTRAGAMLERIPVQTQASSLNPIADAISWNIPVYSIEYFQNWLDKKLAQLQIANEINNAKCSNNTRTFEKKYLKLESVVLHRYRPEFKEVVKWPSIDTNTLLGSCPFDRKNYKKSGKKENHADKKKESERMNRVCNKTANESGYCEICAVHYSDLSQHVTTSSHIKFICNEKNYVDLDNCIKTRSVEAFLAAHNSGSYVNQSKDTNSNELMGRNLRKSVSLHLNNNNENSAVTRSLSNAKLLADESLKQPLQVQCNGFTTNYHLRKSTKSDGTLIKSPSYYASKDLLRESRKPYASCPESGPPNKDSQLSPSKEDNVHRLRSRKNIFLPSILLGTTAEDGVNKNRSGISPQTPTSNHFLRSSMSPKSQSVGYATRGRLHASNEDECRKNVSNSPSTKDSNNVGMYFTRSKLCSTSPNGDCKKHSRSVSPKDENRGYSRQRRKLSVLSDEEEKREKSSMSPRHVPSYQSNKRVKNNVCNDASQSGIKKRMTCEEKFLEDNRDYYKVEMLRTKLRSTEFYCNQEISQVPVVKEEKKETKPDEPVVMRFRKIKQRKQSALHLLNLEAENFLFGPPKNEDDADDTSRESNDEEEKKDEKNDTDKKKDMVNNFKPGRKNKAKRRTQAEVFIHDNLDYYRFEISGSRLRHHSSEGETLKNESDEKSKNLTASCSSLDTVKVKEESITDEEKELPLKKRMKARKKEDSESERSETKTSEKDKTEKSEKSDKSEKEENEEGTDGCCQSNVPAESITFSFESVPTKESWYKTFQRFDTCQEFYIPISNSYIGRFNKVPNGRSIRSTPNDVVSPFHRRKRRSRLGRLIVDDKPRKSPRCHASTLAILSSITNHRRRSRKIHAIEMRKSIDSHRRSESDAIKQATAAINSQIEYETRLKETANTIAKNADEHLIELFANEDCRDKYLEKVRKSSKESELEEESHNCMQLDEGIFQDEDFLHCFIGSSCDAISDMSSFIESSQRCNSMETALDEECTIPRSNDWLSRLCREDYSCNSSDCGASSTCEFLGFAEDGRTVSRRRKRKKPNMTGWPHNNRRRRNIRFSDINRVECNDKETDIDRPSVEENISEADSECTDDDLPLSQIVSRKRRRTNSVITSENTESPKRDCESDGKILLRRSSRGGGSSLPYKRRSSQNQSRRGRRSRCI